jgi:hypothetical protein
MESEKQMVLSLQSCRCLLMLVKACFSILTLATPIEMMLYHVSQLHASGSQKTVSL